MRNGFIIFLSIFILVYISGNVYLYRKLRKFIPSRTWPLILFRTAFIFFSFSFIVAEILEKTGVYCSKFLFIAGGLWLAFLLYSVILYGIFDLVKFMISVSGTGFSPAIKKTGVYIYMFVPVAALLIVLTGAWIASTPVTRVMDITVKNRETRLKELNVAVISDIHLGAVIGKNHLQRLVREINRLNPDLVLIPGDFFDESPEPVIKNNLGGMLQSIRSKYGIYLSTGNHEYIGGVDKAENFINSHGMILLRDKAVIIDKSIIIAGREDQSIKRFSDKKGLSLSDILKDTPRGLPVIVMDHQPRRIDESVSNNVDLHLSGHTHRGQLWPFNYITSLLFRVNYGYEKFNSTSVYVSCGYGTWGPPVRTTAFPEIVIFQIRFTR